MKVSVIIPVEKENENLRRCLKALDRQTFRNFEIIVVSERFKGSPSAKRNWGAKRARGEILAFLDDDCIPERNWIRTGLFLLRQAQDHNDKTSAVVGPMLTPKDSSFSERVGGYLLESPFVMGREVYRNKISNKREVSDYPSANFFIRKSDFEKIGGFDDRFWPGEDTKLCLDILEKLKKKIIYDPTVVVYHRRRPLFRPFLEQVGRYGRQRGRFARMFPKTSRKMSYFLPSLLVIYLAFLALWFAVMREVNLFFLGALIYISLVISVGIWKVISTRNLIVSLAFILGAFATHFVYGINFLRGILKTK